MDSTAVQRHRHFLGSSSQSLPGVQDTALRIRYGPLAQTLSVIPSFCSGCRLLKKAVLPAKDCAVPPAPAVLRCASIQLPVPVRVHCPAPHQRPCSLTPLSRPGSVRGGRLSTHAAGLVRSVAPPFGLAVLRFQARHPHTSRPPPQTRSTSFRVLWHCQTLGRHPQTPHTQSRRPRDWTAP